jgi:hypothetical protein
MDTIRHLDLSPDGAACASFIHYHFKNREKYIEAMLKRKNKLNSCPRKYRVTLNRKGIVHMGGIEAARFNHNLDKQTTAAHSMKHDIFIVSNTVTKPNGKSAKNWDAAKNKTKQSYDNEAYDQDSSQGSEKSLIRRSANSPSKPDNCMELEHEPFSAKDVQIQQREQAYRVDNERARSSRASSRASGSTVDTRPGADTPTGLAFRSETPLYLPDNSDHSHKKIVLQKRGE